VKRFASGMLLLSICTLLEAGEDPCPDKIAESFCSAYSEAGDAMPLKARIVLDRALWSPSKPAAANPLAAGALALVAEYPLKSIDDPDSAYRPRYLDGGSWPIDEYVYNNVAATKRTLDALRSETLVQEIQLGCVKALAYVPMCDSFNVWPPAAWMKVRLYFRMDLETDTAAQIAFFDRYDFRGTEDTGVRLRPEDLVRMWPIAFAVKRKELERMAIDPVVRLLEPWHKDGPTSVPTGPAHSRLAEQDATGRSIGSRIRPRSYRADGRKTPASSAPRPTGRLFARPLP
jgi:hypothetical protein